MSRGCRRAVVHVARAPDILAISIRDVIRAEGCWIHFNRSNTYAWKNYHEMLDFGNRIGNFQASLDDKLSL